MFEKLISAVVDATENIEETTPQSGSEWWQLLVTIVAILAVVALFSLYNKKLKPKIDAWREKRAGVATENDSESGAGAESVQAESAELDAVADEEIVAAITAAIMAVYEVEVAESGRKVRVPFKIKSIKKAE